MHAMHTIHKHTTQRTTHTMHTNVMKSTPRKLAQDLSGICSTDTRCRTMSFTCLPCGTKASGSGVCNTLLAPLKSTSPSLGIAPHSGERCGNGVCMWLCVCVCVCVCVALGANLRLTIMIDHGMVWLPQLQHSPAVARLVAVRTRVLRNHTSCATRSVFKCACACMCVCLCAVQYPLVSGAVGQQERRVEGRRLVAQRCLDARRVRSH